MSLNIAAFDAIYHNFAVTAVDPVNNSFQLVNAGKVKTRGFEVEGEIHPVRNLTLTPGLAYVVGTIDILNTPCCDTQTAAQGCTATKSGRVQNIIGGRLPNAPRLKYDLSVAYRIELPAPLDLSLEANYDYVGNVRAGRSPRVPGYPLCQAANGGPAMATAAAHGSGAEHTRPALFQTPARKIAPMCSRHRATRKTACI